MCGNNRAGKLKFTTRLYNAGSGFVCLDLPEGSSRLLCQFTANATGLPVDSGPSEATVIGNILIQAAAVGKIGSLREMRKVVRDSFRIRSFKPQETSEWKEAYHLYRQHDERRRKARSERRL